jgi:hypothetical protein
MLTGSVGAWLFRTPYTAWPQTGVIAFFPYILLGKLSAPPEHHLQLVVLFHLFRVLAGIALVRVTYAFLAVFLRSIALRRFGTVVAIFGGGLGWVLVLLGQDNWLESLPLDFYSPETFGFLSVFGLPHLAAARTLLLVSFMVLLNAGGLPGRERLRRGSQVGVLWLAMGLFNPLDIPIAWLVSGVYSLFLVLSQPTSNQKEQLVSEGQLLGPAAALSAPLVVYTLIRFSTDPFLAAWTEQNTILSPHPLHYLVAYGLFLPFLWKGARHLQRTAGPQGWFPILWVCLIPLLAYAPYNLQRRLPEGSFLALIVLGFASGDWMPSHGVPRFPKRFLWLMLLFPTTFMLLAGGIQAVRSPGLPIYRSEAEVRAFEALNNLVQPGEVVLTGYSIGNALPAWAPVRVLIGHGPETINLDVLRPRVESFFHPTTEDAEREVLLEEFEVSWILVGPAESAAGWEPGKSPFVAGPLYAQDGYSLYRVDLPSPLTHR